MLEFIILYTIIIHAGFGLMNIDTIYIDTNKYNP